MEDNSSIPNPYSNVGPMTPTPPAPPNVKEVNSKFNFLKSKILIFIGIIIILILLSGAYLFGKNSSSNNLIVTNTSPTNSPTPTVTAILTKTPVQTANFLEIPEYGVKIALSENIKDAYYLPETAAKGYIYLKVHSLDSEPQCKKDISSTAAISRLGKNDQVPYEMTYEEFTTQRATGVTIGEYFYYIDLAQYACAETKVGQALLEKVRKEFSEAAKTIEKL